MIVRKKSIKYEAWTWEQFTNILMHNSGCVDHLPTHSTFAEYICNLNQTETGYFIYTDYGTFIMNEDSILMRYGNDILTVSKSEFEDEFEII